MVFFTFIFYVLLLLFNCCFCYSFIQVCRFLNEDNTTLVWDSEQQVPFAYRDNQWVGFDDERSLVNKVLFNINVNN